MSDGPSASDSDLLEDLVVECLQRYESEGESAVEAVCAAHPSLAAGIRAAITAIRGLAFMPEAAGIAPEGPTEAESATAAAATAIGPYRLLGLLGEGGQGSVHLALDTRLDRKVAVKILTGMGVASPALLARFRREAELASRLDHPSLCAVYDIGTFGGVPYIVMRHVEGETLAARLVRAKGAERGRPSATAADDGSTGVTNTRTTRKEGWHGVEEMLRIVEDAARALHLAHGNGVVHRDIKPANIMVTPEGVPVILDFGLARDLSGGGELLTRTGDVFGTPAYMAPEQISGGIGRVDARADVWALAVTLYECLTLERPFVAPTRDALYRAILQRPAPDPRRCNHAIPGDLKVVLDLALEKVPDARYQTALAFAEDLARVRRREPIAARPTPPLLVLWRWIQRNPSVAALGVVLFAVLAGGLARTLDQGRELKEQTRAFDESTAGSLKSQDQLARAVDGLLLDDLLRRAERELWPRRVAVVPAMIAWMAEAEGLLARHPDANALAETGSTPPLPAAAPPLPLLATSSLDRLRAVLSDIAARKKWAETLEARNVVAHAGAWAACAADLAADPQFNGLSLRPQIDLVPLRKDPDSGLWEFWHPDSGARPLADPATGALIMTEESAIVLVLIPPGELAEVRPRPNVGRSAPAAVGAFFLSKFEMTQGQWSRIAGGNPSEFRPGGAPWHEDPALAGTSLRHPVEWISPVEATEMLRRLGLRAPDENEWEYAARAGTSTDWFTGSTESSLEGFANIGDQCFYRHHFGGGMKPGPLFEDGFVAHAPVGSFRPNPFGLHDMIGNVWELCRDPGAAPEAPAAYRGSSFWEAVEPITRRQVVGLDFRSSVYGVRPARSVGR